MKIYCGENFFRLDIGSVDVSTAYDFTVIIMRLQYIFFVNRDSGAPADFRPGCSVRILLKRFPSLVQQRILVCIRPDRRSVLIGMDESELAEAAFPFESYPFE